jgi:hypothetical protein
MTFHQKKYIALVVRCSALDAGMKFMFHLLAIWFKNGFKKLRKTRPTSSGSW